MNVIITAIYDPKDGVMIAWTTRRNSEEAIDIAKENIQRLSILPHPFAVTIAFTDGTSAIWNNIQKSEILKSI